MNWKEQALFVIEKLTGEINKNISYLKPEKITELVYLKRSVSISFSDQNVNLYNTLMRNGFMVTTKTFVDKLIERFFHTGISVLTSFGYLEETLKDSKKLTYVIDSLSDENSKKTFVDFVEFEIIKSFIGEDFLFSKDALMKIAEIFNDNVAVKKFVEYRFLYPQLKKINENIAEVKTKFGNVKVRSIYSQEVLGEIEYEQYCYNNVCVKNGDIVLDIGAFNGITAVYFVKKGAGVVHSFEPLTYDALLETLDLNNVSNVVVVKKAISSNNENLYVNFFPGGGIYVSRSKMKNTASVVHATSIDGYVKSSALKKVDFVKMDIEGWEMEALYGMRETLKEFRPKMALAAYHRTLDPYKFIKFLEKFGYTKFYLAYNPELVLFATAQ